MMTSRFRRGRLLLCTAALGVGAAPTSVAAECLRAPAGTDALAAGFAVPPNSARPRVWWHWMNGNITETGIRADLEWMSRIGIGGVQNFDAGLATPQVVERRLSYMSPEWKQAFRYSAGLAEQLCMELTIAASPGWSETGGPWVTPAEGMKKLVWSETVVDGGTAFHGTLPAPPSTTGPFQDVPLVVRPPAAPPPTLYRDVAVVAYRLPPAPPPVPVITASGKPVAVDLMTDGRLSTGVAVSKGSPAEPGVILLRYDRPQTMRSLSLGIDVAARSLSPAEFIPALEASDDGATWRKVADVPLADTRQTTIAFAPVTARLFRIVLNRNHFEELSEIKEAPKGAVIRPILPTFTPTGETRLTELRLSPELRVHRAEAKGAWSVERDYYLIDDAPNDAASEPRAPAPVDTIDLTAMMKPDGQLNWRPPAGRWRILRFGYSLLGTTNHPASPEATGLEVDKFDGKAVKRYLDTYLDTYRAAAGSDLFGGKGVRAILTDSIEVGPSNWTPAMIEQFRRRRGYDMRPWLPVLSGAVIGSQRQSNAFLYDFRKTIADFYADEHYKVVADVAHAAGLKVYGEALEGGRASLGDDMAMRSHADVPMSAIWAYQPTSHPRLAHLADMKGASSVSHVYGQNLAAAESFTASFSPWAFGPGDLKRVVDLEFAYGINRPVIHTSVHQPIDKKPGLTLSYFGQYFNRHETWAEFARPWIDYMARSAFLLQQGRNVADVAYLYGEEAPLTGLYKEVQIADAPKRFAYDFVDARAVLDDLSVRDGLVVSKGGAEYRVLYLGGSSSRMTVPMLQRLHDLVQSGATMIGVKPVRSPALSDDPAKFDALVRQMWTGEADVMIGKGRLIASSNIEAGLGTLGLAPDLDHPRSDGTELLFLHRRLADGELYFVSNRAQRAATVSARFRISGYAPQLWHAETGKTEPAAYRMEGGVTVVDLPLDAEEAVFVVFREKTSEQSRAEAPLRRRVVASLDKPWNVSFEAGRGAPEKTSLTKLASLSFSADPGIRYFSGVATYRSSFTVPPRSLSTKPLEIDLGAIGDVAQVSVNGRVAGIAWKAPYRIDVSGLLHAGANAIEIKVANLWVNRLIGDQQPGATKIAFVTGATWRADAPLRPSGLLGPVTLVERDR